MTMGTAVVIGASIAGLLAARALVDHAERVILLERDTLRDAPVVRSGAPQARHIHALLARGQGLLERSFPGLSAELTENGSPQLTWCRDTCYYTAGGWIKRFDSGIVSNVVTRADLEWRIRRRLAAHPRVSFRTSVEVCGLLASPDTGTVRGVTLERRTDHQVEEVAADLVVDASGRGSKAPEWLAALGYVAPEETTVNAYIGYATRLYEKPDGHGDDWRVLFINGRPLEGIKRGAGVFDIGDGKWLVTLGGVNHDYPPTDDAGFLEFARSLPSSTVYDAIKDATPLSPIYGYRITGSRLRHFERLERQPEGFIALGDAVCAFNPLYGQGMTTAAIGADVLAGLLAERQGASMAGLAREYQRRLAKAIRSGWLVATGEDLRYPDTEGDRPNAFERLTQRYIDSFLKTSASDEVLTRAFIDVMNLTAPPTRLFAPGIAARFAVRWLQRRAQPSQTAYSGDRIPPVSA